MAKILLDESRFKHPQKIIDFTLPNLKIGDRVYFKNNQPGKLDLKWRAGYRIVSTECNGHYLHNENQATGKTRSYNVKDVVYELLVKLWNVDTKFGRAGKFINYP